MARAPDTLKIERMAVTGEGVATHQGRAVFVSGAFTGEEVRANVIDEGNVLRGELTAVVKPSTARRQNLCELAESCGGCDWQAITESEQRRLKEVLVRSTLERLGGLDVSAFRWLPTVSGDDALGSRRRAVFHVRKKRLALFGRRSHETVEVARCPALTPSLQTLPSALSDALGSILKDVEDVALLDAGGEQSIAILFKAAIKPAHREAADRARRQVNLSGVVLNPASGKGGPELLGKPVLRDGPWRLRADAFAQAQQPLNAELVRAVVAAIESANTNVLELYCGNGNFTLSLAADAKHVVAIEAAGTSLSLGQQAAEEAHAANIRWIQGDAAKTALALAREGERFERLLVDPPRAGSPKIAECARAVDAQRVVYVACDPASLARDAKALLWAGYRIESAQLFDLFPQTHHVETVMSFIRL
ncbi:MAG: methyltransferase domain-containing protein [Myxococcaceae bacterium]|nr:methyltransferase domain-containing protein [Myxococcaceae bacterium]